MALQSKGYSADHLKPATIWPWAWASGEALFGPAALQLKEESQSSVR